MFTAALFTTAERQKQPSTDKQIVVPSYDGILFSHKKNDILLCVATWRGLISIVLREISQRRTNTIRSLFYMEPKTKQNKKSPRIPKPSSQMQRTD